MALTKNQRPRLGAKGQIFTQRKRIGDTMTNAGNGVDTQTGIDEASISEDLTEDVLLIPLDDEDDDAVKINLPGYVLYAYDERFDKIEVLDELRVTWMQSIYDLYQEGEVSGALLFDLLCRSEDIAFNTWKDVPFECRVFTHGHESNDTYCPSSYVMHHLAGGRCSIVRKPDEPILEPVTFLEFIEKTLEYVNLVHELKDESALDNLSTVQSTFLDDVCAPDVLKENANKASPLDVTHAAYTRLCERFALALSDQENAEDDELEASIKPGEKASGLEDLAQSLQEGAIELQVDDLTEESLAEVAAVLNDFNDRDFELEGPTPALLLDEGYRKAVEDLDAPVFNKSGDTPESVIDDILVPYDRKAAFIPLVDEPEGEEPETPATPVAAEPEPFDTDKYIKDISSGAIDSDFSEANRLRFNRRLAVLQVDIEKALHTSFKALEHSIKTFSMDDVAMLLEGRAYAQIGLINTPEILHGHGRFQELMAFVTEIGRSRGTHSKSGLMSYVEVKNLLVSLLAEGETHKAQIDNLTGRVRAITRTNDVRMDEAVTIIKAYDDMSRHTKALEEKVRSLIQENASLQSRVEGFETDGVGYYVLKHTLRKTYVGYKANGKQPTVPKLKLCTSLEPDPTVSLRFGTLEDAVAFQDILVTRRDSHKVPNPHRYVPVQVTTRSCEDDRVSSVALEIAVQRDAKARGQVPVKRSEIGQGDVTTTDRLFEMPPAYFKMQTSAMFDPAIYPEGTTKETLYSGPLKAYLDSDQVLDVDANELFFHKDNRHVQVGTMPNGSFFVAEWAYRDWVRFKTEGQSKKKPLRPSNFNIVLEFNGERIGPKVMKAYKESLQAFHENADGDYFVDVIEDVFGAIPCPKDEDDVIEETKKPTVKSKPVAKTPVAKKRVPETKKVKVKPKTRRRA